MFGYLQTPESLIDQVWNNSKVRIQEKTINSQHYQFTIIDVFANNIQTLFPEDSFLLENISAGITILQIMTASNRMNKKKKMMYVRRTIQPKYELQRSYMKYFTQGQSLLKVQVIKMKTLFRRVNRVFEQKKCVEMINLKEIRGDEIEISFCDQYNRWLISSNNITVLFINQDDLNIYTQKIYQKVISFSKIWLKYFENLPKGPQIKKVSSNHTLIGKIRNNKIIFHGIVPTDNNCYSICQDPFQAKQILQNLGLKFAKIKSLGIFKEKKTFYQYLQNLSENVSWGKYQNAEGEMQALNLYFIINSLNGRKQSNSVIGYGKITTFEDKIYQAMKKCLYRCKNAQNVAEFKDIFRNLINGQKQRPPNAQKHYRQVFLFMNQLIKKEAVFKKFNEIPFELFLKYTLYLQQKRISIQKFGQDLISNQNFMNQLSLINLQKFGSVNCKTIILYYFLQLSGSIWDILTTKIDATLRQMESELTIIHQAQTNEPLAQKIKQLEKEKTLTHIFIHGYASIQSIKKTMRKLLIKANEDCHYKIIVIKQANQSTILCQNQYPFSISNIVNCYVESLEKTKNEPKLDQKIKAMSFITKELQRFKNVDNHTSNLFELQIQQKKTSKDVIKSIESVLTHQGHPNERQCYLELMARLKNIEVIKWNLREQIQKLIKTSYSCIPTILYQK